MSTKLELKNIVKQYDGNPVQSVKNFNLTVNPGEMVAFLGPSGCGKTTTLRMIAGLIEPTEGEILFDGKSVLSIPPEKREVSMVFQKSMLFPHMSINDNVAFGLKMRKRPKAEIDSKVKEILEFVHLGEYGKRKPSQLSGGQEQRVSLARGLVINPKVLLLDEPLSALDASLRIEMRDLIISIQKKLGVTSIFVTHDQEEAVMLADKIALMFDGKLQQYGRPEIFYQQPRTKRIAQFFGCNNFIKGKQHGKVVDTCFGSYEIKDIEKADRDVYLVARAENFIESNDADAIKGKVINRIFMGVSVKYLVENDKYKFEVTLEGFSNYQIGDDISLKFNEEKLWAVAQDDSI